MNLFYQYQLLADQWVSVLSAETDTRSHVCTLAIRLGEIELILHFTENHLPTRTFNYVDHSMETETTGVPEKSFS